MTVLSVLPVVSEVIFTSDRSAKTSFRHQLIKVSDMTL